MKKNEERGEKTEGKVNGNKQETFILTTKRSATVNKHIRCL